MNYTLIEKGLQDILDKYTPHIIKDKKLYEEKDVLEMLRGVDNKWVYPYDQEVVPNVEQYPESTC